MLVLMHTDNSCHLYVLPSSSIYPIHPHIIQSILCGKSSFSYPPHHKSVSLLTLFISYSTCNPYDNSAPQSNHFLPPFVHLLFSLSSRLRGSIRAQSTGAWKMEPHMSYLQTCLQSFSLFFLARLWRTTSFLLTSSLEMYRQTTQMTMDATLITNATATDLCVFATTASTSAASSTSTSALCAKLLHLPHHCPLWV